MPSRRRELFTTVRTEGAILPADLLQRVAANDRELPGLDPDTYHLAAGERLNERITQSWNRLVGAWAAFREARERLPAGDPGTTVTRERWLLPLFQELGYGRLLPVRGGLEAGGKAYPVSHAWGSVPIHLLGCQVRLDTRTRGVSGAATQSPHSLLQELLNRSPERLYGFVSNGLVLRLLRDNTSLTRQAYVEFDLQAMLDGEVFADFALLWMVCHQSRVEGDPPEACWLERWSREAAERGTRALDALRDGVERAIKALGAGFLAHPANHALRDALRAGRLSTQDYYRELLRLVYRLLFLFAAEDRGLLLDPGADPAARERYERWYSTDRLRRLAERRRGTRHGDLWHALRLVMASLDAERGCPDLALPALGSFLWSPQAIAHLGGCELANADLLAAVRALCFVKDRGSGAVRPVDYKNLGTEELGSVYESLLELHPKVHAEAGTFELASAAGHERRTTGSYYTPPALVQALLDSALEPVLDEAVKAEDPEAAILSLKVCDPAAGSGHFLVGAAHRIARRLAAVRTGDLEPAPAEVRRALRDVTSRCLFGVDVNDMAVELCKIFLWMEGLEPGKPLSFLDAHIKHGNSLLGVTPALLAAGLPDTAFEALSGDDREVVKSLKKRNRTEREMAKRGQVQLALLRDWRGRVAQLAAELAAGTERLDAMRDDSPAALRSKEQAFEALRGSGTYRRAKLTADAWCAAFFQRKLKDYPHVTHDTVRRLAEDPETVDPEALGTVQRLAEKFKFFHWHIEFPQVFHVPDGAVPGGDGTGWTGGFDVVLGNPPWERVKLQEKEFFTAAGHAGIAQARNKAERERRIKALAKEDPILLARFEEEQHAAEAESTFLRKSGRYPLCGRGDVNTYAVFAEGMRALLAPRGQAGCIVPTGIATDDTTKHFFADLMERQALVSLYDFENRGGIFPAIHRSYKFCLLTVGGAEARSGAAEFAFFLHDAAHLHDPERRFTLSREDIALLNPNTRTCPTFRTRRDAEITKALYRRVPVLINEREGEAGNPWRIEFMRMLDMANDSWLFRSREELTDEGFQLDGNRFVKGSEVWLPLYEAKMVHHFDHRYGDYAMRPEGSQNAQLPTVPVERLQDPDYAPLPRYWVNETEVEDRLQDRWSRGWLLGWRDICRSTDERTVIASVIPQAGVGDTFLLAFPMSILNASVGLAAVLSSFVLDFAARQKVGGTHLKYHVFKQLPVIPPDDFNATCPWELGATVAKWVHPRVLELTYTAWDLEPFARDLGYDGPPFRWEPERRFLLRCELDAAFFHLYGVAREDAEYILDTFPIVRRHDEQRYGEYRTKRVILEIYDAMAEAVATGRAYRTRLDPPPADPAVAHPPRGARGNRPAPADWAAG